ncbi:YihY/virulence factor BrkB family protein [Polymorphum gilvum]|uniref:Putative ribonuclease rnase bn (Rbn) transmembrane protein n=1 Tax=Polymorphum gilvum (strain LMG 25793 / CGMCC 1.9160 / SL003B-26A1) TaxID=991905 RepID=F2J314_POLGS|nr:YihY/virulence factor BrkB family protein [Polymorphum gilvum]ADZ68884.1 Putative ribonuclease rnase bn (Rbn) transmembrane protein [Polymorphum gilvum SL003B-26A1]
MTLSKRLVIGYRVLGDALGHFNRDDGWAMASHVALSSLLALFPLLIFIAALAGFLGLTGTAARVSELIFEAWPEQVAAPVANEIKKVLTVPRGDLLTFGVVAALWFASNGVEAVRVALNRAYRVIDTRPFVLLRLQSILLVLLCSIGLIAFTFLMVLAPLALAAAHAWFPWLADFAGRINAVRYGAASLVAVAGLIVVHAVLPAGRRRFVDILPGVAATLALWLAAGAAFGAYLAGYADYVSTYAGLAGVMSALVFLYIVALALLIGGELNAALIRQRDLRRETAGAGAGG